MKKIGLIIAMQKELEFYANFLNDFTTHERNNRKFYQGKYSQHELIITVSGIGKVNSALCCSDLINIFNPDIIINIGISGGLNSSLNIGDFVIGEEIVYHDVWCGEPNKYGQIQDCPAIYHSHKIIYQLPYSKGLICCGDKFITKSQELNNIIECFPSALAVDMESAAIAQTCHIYNKPFMSIRQISDVPGTQYQQEQYTNFWNNAPQNSVNVIKDILDRI